MKKKIWIYKLLIIWALFFLINSCQKDNSNPKPKHIIEYGTVTDIDGNSYKTVKIGNQWWMAENLKVTRYRNGDPIQHITNNADWRFDLKGAYCNYENDIEIGKRCGKLYNWSAVRVVLAPSGWHIPTNDEWTTLTDYLTNNEEFGNLEMGDCIAESMGWSSKTINIDDDKAKNRYNSTGFNAIQCGFRQGNGVFVNGGSYSNWWSYTYFGNGLVWCRHMYSDDHCNVFDIFQGFSNGFSVRCVKD